MSVRGVTRRRRRRLVSDAVARPWRPRHTPPRPATHTAALTSPAPPGSHTPPPSATLALCPAPAPHPAPRRPLGPRAGTGEWPGHRAVGMGRARGRGGGGGRVVGQRGRGGGGGGGSVEWCGAGRVAGVGGRRPLLHLWLVITEAGPARRRWSQQHNKYKSLYNSYVYVRLYALVSPSYITVSWKGGCSDREQTRLGALLLLPPPLLRQPRRPPPWRGAWRHGWRVWPRR